MKQILSILTVLGTLSALLSGCASPAPGGSVSSASQGGGASVQGVSPQPAGSASLPREEEPSPAPENSPEDTASGRQESIPFSGDQLYAAAYVGYEGHLDLEYYTDRYLDDEKVPIHYFSPWEYYLIIPRYPDMSLALYKNDIQTDQPALVYEAPVCQPFLIQCNISDIFPDVTVELTYQGESVSFSPHLSLKDGSVQIGERGLDLTASGG